MNLSLLFFVAHMGVTLSSVAGSCADPNFCSEGETCVDSGEHAFTLENGTVVPYCTFQFPPQNVCGRRGSLVRTRQDCGFVCQRMNGASSGTYYESTLNDTYVDSLCRCEDANGVYSNNVAICVGIHPSLCLFGLGGNEPNPCSPGYSCAFYSRERAFCSQDPDSVPICPEYPETPILDGIDCSEECDAIHGPGEGYIFITEGNPPVRSLCRCETENDGICATPFDDSEDSTNVVADDIFVEFEGISRVLDASEIFNFYWNSSLFFRANSNDSSLLVKFGAQQELKATSLLIATTVESLDGYPMPGQTAVDVINENTTSYLMMLNGGWQSLEATGVSAEVKPSPTSPPNQPSTPTPTMATTPPPTPQSSLPPSSADTIHLGFIVPFIALAAASLV